MNRTRYARPCLVAVVATIITACGGSETTAPAPGGLTITASPSLTFTPASLTVDAGAVVTYDFGAVAHNVFFDATAGAPANIEGSKTSVSVQRTFTSAGTYHYTCQIHPGMQGTVTVR